MSPGLHVSALLSLALTVGSTLAHAQAVYRSVDAEGNVTFSDTPPAADTAREVQQITLDPGPDQDARNAAHDRMRAFEQAEQARVNRAEEQAAARKAAVAEAQQAVIRAKAELEQAKIQGDGDWQWIAGGGRVLSAAYFERVAAAEARVEAAEKDLAAARSGR